MTHFINTYANLPSCFFSLVDTTQCVNAPLQQINPYIQTSLQLHHLTLGPTVLDCIQDCAVSPLAMAYAGHQFGINAGQLGDGRGALIAQYVHAQLIDLHLKGIGKTPYSRGGDGRAVLRSSIREFLAGHALHHLHIPSTNALALWSNAEDKVWREVLEPTAYILRTAKTHIRFGHFEWINRYAPEHLTTFTEYCIAQYFPTLSDVPERYEAFIAHIVCTSASLLAQWQLIGFAHGVMNTDNMSVLGETLDFGPFAFMQRFEPNWQHNHSDHQKRYVFAKQPSIMFWNLNILLTQFLPLGIPKHTLVHALEQFEPLFYQQYYHGLLTKLGLATSEHLATDSNADYEQHAFLFLQYLEAYKLDYTNAFRAINNAPEQLIADCQPYGTTATDNMEKWLTQHQHLQQQLKQRTQLNSEAIHQHMNATNPIYILRNEMAERAIHQAYTTGSFSEVERLLHVLATPYTTSPYATSLDTSPPDINTPPIALSCSS